MNYQLISEFIESIKSTNGHPLTKIEENNLCTFIDTLGRENATIVFRGDKSDVFMTSDISELSYKIFMVGPKAASFWKQRSIYLKKNICKSLIVSLYSEFEKAFNLDRIKSPNSKEHIKNFINSEQDFASYFAHENKDDFYNKIKDLHVCEKQFVMDYYNTILHSMGNLVHHGSYQISTTTKLEIAKKISNDIIYVAWIPQMFLNNLSTICFKNRELCNKKIADLRLPICNVPSVFPEQSEVCIKFGILPHFLLGFIFNGQFFVNRNLFTTSKTYEECITYGFDIDQSNFNKVFSSTKYKRFYSILDGDYYCEISPTDYKRINKNA